MFYGLATPYHGLVRPKTFFGLDGARTVRYGETVRLCKNPSAMGTSAPYHVVRATSTAPSP